MLKHLLPLLLLTVAAGCAAKSSSDSEASVDPTAPGATDAPPAQPGPSPSSPTEGGVIDFGAEPTGGPSLSTMTCPELTLPASPATVYVDASAKGAEKGTKSAPFRTVAMAFANAGPKGVVYVARGTYKENLYVPSKDLTVFGGFTADFASRTSACDTILEAGYVYTPVLTVTDDVKSFAIEGVTVRKGARGILVYGDDAKPGTITVARSVFTDNGEKSAVGGALFLDNVNARVFRSVFRDNQAAKGAAIAGSGDGVALTIDQNVFLHNLGYSDHGGGLYLSAKSSKISRNTFRGNATGVGIKRGWGGAVIVYANSPTEPAKAAFSYNVFTENVAGIGGAVFVDDGASITMSHDLLYRNRAYPENGFLRGAAIYVDGTGYVGGGSTFTGEYLTVVNNVYDDAGAKRATTFGGNVYVEGYSKATFTSSIFWNNGDNGFYVEAGDNELTVGTSIAPSACASGSGNGLVPATAAACKIGAGVFQPSSLAFSNEAADDYRESTTGLGAFSPSAANE